MLKLKKSKQFITPLPYAKLEEIAKRSTFCFLYLGSQPHNIAVLVRKSELEKYNEESIRQVYIYSETDMPLWKQHMDLQMGKRPRKTSDFKPIGVQPIEKSRRKIAYFQVYELF